MSMPALRQPKIVKEVKKDDKNMNTRNMTNTSFVEPQNYLIVSLKDGKKLVVSSDAYHGIFKAVELYRCVFCETEMVREVMSKERHKTSENHRKILESYPHMEDFKENLIRKLNGSTYYCTICNVIVTSQFLHKHIMGEVHIEELQKAIARAQSYKPSN